MKLRPLLRLARIPNVFTAFANSLAGAFIVREGALRLKDLLLIAASGALYVGGMVLNDFFDRRIDAIERPERPIPSGEVQSASALLLGALLLTGGIALAALHGLAPFAVAVLLAVSIVLYDAVAKSTLVGPLVMGACRFLNVTLGLYAVEPSGLVWIAPFTMGAFTIAITVLSRDEVKGGGIARVRAVLFGLALLAALFVAALIPFARERVSAGAGFGIASATPFAILLFVRGVRNFAPLRHDASAPTIGRAIGGGILLMPAIDATVVAAAGLPFAALLVLALTVPAALLKRWYYLT